MKQITQAVILCGGKGTRLGKLTKNKPKPMILISGKPFLEHLFVQLKKNGIKNILLLIGYKNEIIKKYFKNGKKLGLNIVYSYLPEKADTAERLYNAKKLLNKSFLLLYSDNYTSLNINKLANNFFKSKKKILLLLSKKKNGNCKIDKFGKVQYFRKRNIKNNFVEIGYMLFQKNLLKLLDKKTKNLSDFLEKLSKKNLIDGIKTENNYLSIGDSKRLKETQKFFNNNDFILIDRDGVINIVPEGERYLTSLQKLKINKKLIKKLPISPKYLCITNQAGISTGELNIKNLYTINNKIKKILKINKINLKNFFISTHHFKSNSFYRKPNPGLFIKASNKYQFILDKTFYIGDDIRDIEAAYNANTFIIYIGKKKLSSFQKKKYRFIILKKNIKKLYNEKKKFNF